MKLKSGIATSIAAGTIALCVASMTACSSGSSSSSATNPTTNDSGSGSTNTGTTAAKLAGQAVDGYLVNGDVYCDGKANGKTQAAGRYTCPAGTKVVRVRNGVDVGFSETETASGNTFNGEVTGPADAEYISPLSTLVLELAGGEDGFDPGKVALALEKNRSVFSLPDVHLYTPPETNIQLARFNAQAGQMMSVFSRDADEFRRVSTSFARLIDDRYFERKKLDIAGGSKFDSDFRALNAKIRDEHSDLGISDTTELERKLAGTKAACKGIEDTSDVDSIDDTVKNLSQIYYAVGIRESQAIVEYQDCKSKYTTSLVEFEDDTKYTQDRYATVLNCGINHVAYDSSALDVSKTLVDAPVDVGIAVEATDSGDPRRLNFVGSGVKVTMTEGDSTSIKIVVPNGLEWHAKGVKQDGTETTATIGQEGNALFDGANKGININFGAISKWLKDRDYLDPTGATGNFKVTMVVKGLKMARLKNEHPGYADAYTVSAGGDNVVSGAGFQGYVSIVSAQ